MTEISANLQLAKSLLESDELVAIPTETVYGMAGNGFSEEAIKKIFLVKNRPFYDPLILHTDSVSKIEQWGMKVPEQLKKLANAFWPGPLTLLIDRSEYISDLVTSGLPRVAFRVPNHRLTRELLAMLDFPVAAPSANPFGYVSPTSPKHVFDHFNGKIQQVLDGGLCEVGIESTIVGVEDGQVVVYRLGGLSIESIEAEVGSVIVKTSSSKPDAPGMLSKHYAPNKEIVTVDTQKELNAVEKMGSAYILFNLDVKTKPERLIKLSVSGDFKEAASKFYDALRNWDQEPAVRRLVIERMPDLDLGRAINDRLLRAASKG